MRKLIIFVVGMLMMALTLSLTGSAFQEKKSKKEQNTSIAAANKSDPSGAQAKAGGVTFTNGQVCSVYVGGAFRDSITVPDGFSIAACRDFQVKAGCFHYQLGCATPTGIAFSSEDAGAWGCGWH
jgi:hypothetical protein